MESKLKHNSTYHIQLPLYEQTSAKQIDIHVNMVANESIEKTVKDIVQQEQLEKLIDYKTKIIPLITQLDRITTKTQSLKKDPYIFNQIQNLVKSAKQQQYTQNIKQSSPSKISNEMRSPFNLQEELNQDQEVEQQIDSEGEQSVHEKVRNIRKLSLKELQNELNSKLAQMIENKREEWSYLSEEQLKEIDRARVLSQSDKDKQLIIERHLKDTQDWMTNAQQQMIQSKSQLIQEFWKEWSNSTHSDPTLRDQVDQNQLINCDKIRISQGIVKKIEIDLIISLNVISNFKFSSLSHIDQLMSSSYTRTGMLNFSYFEDNNQQNMEKYSKFLQFSEINSIEDNFPLMMNDKQLKSALISNIDFVYKQFTIQIKDMMQPFIQLKTEQSKQANYEYSNIFKDGDIVYTNHTNLDVIDVIFNGLINYKNMTSKKQYLQLLYQSIKIANHYGIECFIVRFDFLIHIGFSKVQDKYQKIIQKMIQIIKQAIYEISFEQHQKLKSVVISVDQASENANQSERENRVIIADYLRKIIGITFN
ncbi:UNKNOWN [Stylonychia lemnae]|uniref:Uncharacterized protein n=1 Tax=Stylonychia lemnae TaxID=5949 RepID=A0A078AYB1_STYLE|nr:UNKNOWN [Stylonychia lemnae]|eukprot:CDW87121.1 UNKNOWN [Stylonychia lemnae]